MCHHPLPSSDMALPCPRRLHVLAFVSVGLLLAPLSQAEAATWQVDNGVACDDATGTPFCTIQAAIDKSAAGDTIRVNPGTYTGTLEIVGRNGLSILGTGRAQVIVRPASTLGWNVGGFTTQRTTPIRVVGSIDLRLSGITFDFDAIKGDQVYGILLWNSSATLDSLELRNMSVPDTTNGYFEYAIYARAPDFTDAARAQVTVRDSNIVDPGRVGFISHGFVHAVLERNNLTKTVDDFGFAIELGSTSTGVIRENVIQGFDTPAQVDESSSVGIYVENAFTSTSAPLKKSVVISDNDIRDNQIGVYIGNTFPNLSGDVDIEVTFQRNKVYENSSDGVFVADEGRNAGSSVTLQTGGNLIAGNGGAGYHLSTGGNGELHVHLRGDDITGQKVGVHVEDAAGGTSASLYDVSARFSRIVGHTEKGIRNDTTAEVDATNNWWGCNAGPGQVDCDAVSAGAKADPWLVFGIASPRAVLGGANAAIATSLRVNSAGQDTSAEGTAPDGMLVTFGGTLGTFDSPSVATHLGLATANVSASRTPGRTMVMASCDRQALSIPVWIVIPPVVTAPADGALLGTGRPWVTGTAAPNTTVTVSVDDGVVMTTAADASGAWSMLTPRRLADGRHTLVVTTTDDGGNVSPPAGPQRFTVDTIPPPAPVVTAPTQGGLVARVVAIEGTAEPGSTVTAYVDGEAVGTATADSASGAWSVPLSRELTPGNHTTMARATDAVGNVGLFSDAITFQIRRGCGCAAATSPLDALPLLLLAAGLWQLRRAPRRRVS